MSKSTTGRQRLLTDKQIVEILEWNRTRLTLQDIARKYQVSKSVIVKLLGGRAYKRASPEKIA